MRRIILLTVAGVIVLGSVAQALAMEPEPDAAALFPQTTVLYGEVSRPAEILSAILSHPLRSKLESSASFRDATQTQPYRDFLTARKVFEIQMGMDWPEAVKAMTEGGVFAGFDAATNGVALLVKGRDAATMEQFRTRLLEMTRLGQPAEKRQQSEYRGIAAYKLENGGAAVVGKWLVVVNRPELGKAILDRLLDAGVSSGEATGESLAASAEFQSARMARRPAAALWAFADLNAVRKDDHARKQLTSPAVNPLAELLAGGIQSILQHAASLTAEFTMGEDALQLSVRSPWNAKWIPEQRAWYFGSEQSQAPALPDVKHALLTSGTWRDVSAMWLRSDDLFDENMQDQLASADNTLTTLFAGKDFGEDILASFQPEIGLIVTRQDFSRVSPRPTIRLPAFALILQLRDPDRMTRELRRTFQSIIGFFNVVGAMEGRPQLEMDIEKFSGAELISSVYLAEPGEESSEDAEIYYNFSPSAGFSGSQFVLSSTRELAREILQADPVAAQPSGRPNSYLRLSAPVLRQVLEDNRDHLISQNMLEQGHAQDEASAQVSLLLGIVDWFEGAEVRLERTEDALRLQLDVSLRDDHKQTAIH